jgi:hypothetical protein
MAGMSDLIFDEQHRMLSREELDEYQSMRQQVIQDALETASRPSIDIRLVDELIEAGYRFDLKSKPDDQYRPNRAARRHAAKQGKR